MTANLPLSLLMLGGGTLIAWVGFANPDGGVTAELRRVLAGTPSPLKAGASAADGTAYAAAFLTSSPAAGDGQPSTPAAGGSAARVITEGKAQIGKPYLWGGNGPDAFDCSGLTRWAYSKGAGITLPRIASAQAVTGRAVGSMSQAQPGDLVYFGTPAYHIALYLGGGQMLSADRPGTKVQVEPVWTAQLGGFRRILGAR